MDIFISWSGSKSKIVAEELASWLPNCIQSLKTWVSFHDIEKGHRWGQMLSQRLETASFGIVCLTSNNLNSPWLLFEAGALSKELSARTCTFLIDVTPANVEFPLGQFQHTLPNEKDVFQLLVDINKACGENALDSERLKLTFAAWWPDLNKVLASLPEDGGPELQTRSCRSILEEILEAVKPGSSGVPVSSGLPPDGPSGSPRLPSNALPSVEEKRMKVPPVAIPLSPKTRSAYQALYDANQNLLEHTADPALLEPLNDIRVNVGNILTKDNLYRLEANTILFQALAHQINSTNKDLLKIKTSIEAIVSRVALAESVVGAIDNLLRVVIAV